MTVIIDGHVDRDDSRYQHMPMPIGPFPDREAADAWMQSQQPLWGSWDVKTLTAPEDA